MTTVYKYQIQVDDFQQVGMPKGAEILSVITNHEEVFVYAKVDTEQQIVPYNIYMVGTGHDSAEIDDKVFLGTITLRNGKFVGHVFID